MSTKKTNLSSPSDPHGIEPMEILFKRSGVVLSRLQLEQFLTYHQLLRQYNPELNLTRIHNFTNMVLKLYVDSVLPGQFTELPTPLLDLGTGPGMPGIPLKIVYPHLEILLAESRKNRTAFLEKAVERLGLEKVRIIDRGITPKFQEPVAGVITRAVEDIGATLERVRGCLASEGCAIFMKGPNCNSEIQKATDRFPNEYRLIQDTAYRIPHTDHERRLVIFQRRDIPPYIQKAKAMERHPSRKIESEQNSLFKDLKKLLTSRGIKKQEKALVSGSKQISEILEDFPHLCEAWISSGDQFPPPEKAPPHLAWYQTTSELFQALDIFGTHSPLLLVKTPKIEKWEPTAEFPKGCTLLIPFQDPENVGAMVRSAVAFGAAQIILLDESAHPFHPKALRASGGNVFRIRLLQGPALSALPEDLPLISLSSEGKDIATVAFPPSFGFLLGIEGPGLPDHWRNKAVSIPIRPEANSLNATVAAAIALYVWSRFNS